MVKASDLEGATLGEVVDEATRSKPEPASPLPETGGVSIRTGERCDRRTARLQSGWGGLSSEILGLKPRRSRLALR